MTNKHPLSKSPWLPISKWEDAGFEWPSKEALRNYYRDREANGLASAFRKYGRSTLVSPARFFALVGGTPLDDGKGGNAA